MRIEHLALWTTDLERARAFYATWFHAQAGARYENPRTGFSSYFLSFTGGARLELMSRARPAEAVGACSAAGIGLAHFAVSLGSETAVDAMTKQMRDAGCVVTSAPRRTGDGYYESVVLDPDGNPIELTI